MKIKAFLTHLALSALILLIFISMVLFIWYPTPYLTVEGGGFVIMILIGVSLMLGPILTLVVYKPGKKGLFMDIILIACMQISAFLYGAYTIYIERPQYIAFTIDRFNVVPASSINTTELHDRSLYNSPLNAPKFVYVARETDREKKNKLIFSTIQGGKDIEKMPEYYREYSQFFDDIINDKHQLKLQKIIKINPKNKYQVEQVAKDFNTSIEQLVFYPLKGSERDMLIVLNKNNKKQYALLDIYPWIQ